MEPVVRPRFLLEDENLIIAYRVPRWYWKCWKSIELWNRFSTHWKSVLNLAKICIKYWKSTEIIN